VRRYLLRSLLRNRGFLESATMALVLPFVAGLVNAEGFFIVGVYTSHVTGTVARAGDELAQGHFLTGLHALGMVASFYSGAFGASALVMRARRRQKARYSAALAAEIVTLLTVTFLGLFPPANFPFTHPLTLLLLCFAMGAQNALVTKLSGAVVRTTHLTGIVTDLGIESVRAVVWFRDTARQRPLGEKVRILTHFLQFPELKKLRLHSAIFLSFFSGAVVGPLLYLREGYSAMLLPIVVLTALLIFDAAIGLRSVEDVPAGAAALVGTTAPVAANAGETPPPDPEDTTG
jgi:uncharacterized membrane protein YoaK (UPF0700 family)